MNKKNFLGVGVVVLAVFLAALAFPFVSVASATHMNHRAPRFFAPRHFNDRFFVPKRHFNDRFFFDHRFPRHRFNDRFFVPKRHFDNRFLFDRRFPQRFDDRFFVPRRY